MSESFVQRTNIIPGPDSDVSTGTSIMSESKSIIMRVGGSRRSDCERHMIFKLSGPQLEGIAAKEFRVGDRSKLPKVKPKPKLKDS